MGAPWAPGHCRGPRPRQCAPGAGQANHLPGVGGLQCDGDPEWEEGLGSLRGGSGMASWSDGGQEQPGVGAAPTGLVTEIWNPPAPVPGTLQFTLFSTKIFLSPPKINPREGHRMGNRTQGLVSKETVHATQSGHSSAHPQLCSEQLSPPVDMVNICLPHGYGQ